MLNKNKIKTAKKKKKKKKRKGKKEITTSYPCNLWTNTTNISKSAFLSRRRDNVCHLYNHSFLLPLWPFGGFDRANCSSFTGRDGSNLMRHLRWKMCLSHMERIFKEKKVQCAEFRTLFSVFFFHFSFILRTNRDSL